MTTLKQEPTQSIECYLKDQLQLPQALDKLRSEYQQAKPFKHLVMDNIFPTSLIENVTQEIPSMNGDNWVHQEDENLVKYNLRSVVQLRENGAKLVALLHSGTFLYFLSEVTEIWELLPDPYLQGAGFHLLPNNGKFNVHVDRNTAYETGLVRRLAMIIYLNKEWKHEYGGQLELWNADGSRCETVIEPTFNRTVIFEINHHNYHGVPPVTCPKERTRNSFAVYYHTAATNSEKQIAPHTSIYGPRAYQNDGVSFRKIVKDVTPPFLLRGIKAVGRKMQH
jgi:hypothetical protein